MLLDYCQNLYQDSSNGGDQDGFFKKRYCTMSSLDPFHACHSFDPTPKRAVSSP